MVNRDGAEVRRQRIADMAKTVQAALTKNKAPIPLLRTIAILSVKLGLSKERVREYLEDLEATGEQNFEIDNDKDEIRRVTADECV